MNTSPHPIQQLEQIAWEFRHVRHSHQHEGRNGTWRRNMGGRLDDLEDRFNTLLQRWICDDTAREGWRQHLHRGEAHPDDDLVTQPPLFVGVSSTPAEIRLYPRAGGGYDVFIDGARADRAPSALTFPASGQLRMLDQSWEEISLAPEPALRALREYCAAGSGEPPWQYARELYANGLIDVNFGLTPRGRRLVL